MNSLFSSSVKSGLIALGLISGLTAPSAAGPMFQPDLSIPASTAAQTITPVRDSWAGGNDRQYNNDWRWRRSGNWNGGGNWDRGDNWRWRHSGRHYRGGYDDAAGAAILGLGLGLGLGSVYGNNYNYYEPAPRRYYRTYRTQRVSSAHVQWCYNRYRSYRAFDNTFQPYNGPRQQCWSPYS